MVLYNVCAAITLISALVSCGFSLQAVTAANRNQNGSLITAQYALSRSVMLAVVAIGLFIFRNDNFLVAMMVIMTGVQFFDGLIGRQVSTFKTVGPMTTAIVNAVALGILLAA